MKQEQKVYEEPEIVGQGASSHTSTSQQQFAGTQIPLRKIITTILVTMGVFLLLVGALFYFLFWILFAILPDSIAYILLGVFLFIVGVNAIMLLGKGYVLFGKYQQGKQHFDFVRDNLNNR